jgi:peptidyl-prolyl cis-trans isomerase A (cyclophilin A)
MRKLLILLIAFSSLQLVSQTAAPAAKKPAPKKPSAATALPPTAIIDTTAGKLTCVLFPDKAPIGVANFIGLARGTKDWTNPASGRKMHGVPLYNGTNFPSRHTEFHDSRRRSDWYR